MMSLLLPAAIGAAGGLAIGLATCTRRHFATGAAATSIGAAWLGATSSWMRPWAALLIGATFVIVSVSWRWRTTMSEVSQRAFRSLPPDRGVASSVVRAEIAGAWHWIALSAGLGVLSVVTTTANQAAWATILIVVPFLRRRLPSPGSEAVAVPTDTIALVEDRSEARSIVLGLLDGIRSAGGVVASTTHPPHLFRGLAGWNLGLGLDAEQAAWAGQMARSLGVGNSLAEPSTLVGPEAAAKLLICRSLAATSDVVVLDEPLAYLGAKEARQLAHIVGSVLGTRRLIVTTSDPDSHRSFLARVESGG